MATAVNRFIDRLDLACRYPDHPWVYYFKRLDLATCFPNMPDNRLNGPSMTFALDYYLGSPQPQDQTAICRMISRQLSEPQETPDVDIPEDPGIPYEILNNDDDETYDDYEARLANAKASAANKAKNERENRAAQRFVYKSRMAEMVGSAAHMLRPSEDDTDFKKMIALCTGQFNEAGYFVDGASAAVTVALASKDKEQLAALRDITCPVLHSIRKKYAGHKHLPGNTNQVLGKAFMEL